MYYAHKVNLTPPHLPPGGKAPTLLASAQKGLVMLRKIRGYMGAKVRPTLSVPSPLVKRLPRRPEAAGLLGASCFFPAGGWALERIRGCSHSSGLETDDNVLQAAEEPWPKKLYVWPAVSGLVFPLSDTSTTSWEACCCCSAEMA